MPSGGGPSGEGGSPGGGCCCGLPGMASGILFPFMPQALARPALNSSGIQGRSHCPVAWFP